MTLLALSILLFFPVLLLPGWSFARRFSSDGLEHIALASAFGALIVGYGGFALYICSASQVASRLAICSVFVLFTFIAWNDRRGARTSFVYAPSLLTLMWWSCAVITAVFCIRVYSGERWHSDWHNQFLTSGVFSGLMEQVDINTLIKRPPLMDLVVSIYFRLLGNDGNVYFTVSTLLKSLVILPMLLLMRFLAPQQQKPSLHVSLLFVMCASPFLMQQITFSWTKLFAVFYLLLGAYFYLCFIQTDRRRSLIVSGVLLSAATLVHWLALPYVASVTIFHLFYVVGTKRLTLLITPSVLSALLAAGVLCPWFIWVLSKVSLQTYAGAYDPGYGTSEVLGFTEAIERCATRLWVDVIPPLFRDFNTPDVIVKVRDNLFQLRDYIFLLYQRTILFAPGVLGICIALAGLFRLRKSESTKASVVRFFWVFPVLGIVGSWLLISWNEQAGMAHLYSQPLVCICLCFVAAALARAKGRAFSWMLVTLLIEMALGVWLTLYAQGPYTSSLLSTPWREAGKPVDKFGVGFAVNYPLTLKMPSGSPLEHGYAFTLGAFLLFLLISLSFAFQAWRYQTFCRHPRRILFIGYDFPPDPGPLAKISKTLVEWFCRHWPVYLHTRNFKGHWKNQTTPSTTERSTSVSFRTRFFSFFHFIAGSIGTSLTCHPHGVVVVMSNPPLLDTVHGLILNARSIPYIVVAQEIYPEFLRTLNFGASNHVMRGLQSLRNIAYRGARRVICISDDSKSLLAKQSIEHMEVIQNWFSLPESVSPPAVLETLQTGPLRIRFAGNLGMASDLHFLESVLGTLQDQTRFRFLFHVEGYKVTELTRLAERFSCINIHRFEKIEKQLPSDIQDCDVHLILTHHEAYGAVFSSKLYFAMACAQPIIAFVPPASQMHELIRTSGCGWSAGSQDVQAAISCLEQAYALFHEDPRAFATIGRQGRAAHERNNNERLAEEGYLRVLREVIQEDEVLTGGYTAQEIYF